MAALRRTESVSVVAVLVKQSVGRPDRQAAPRRAIERVRVCLRTRTITTARVPGTHEGILWATRSNVISRRLKAELRHTVQGGR